MNYSLPPTAHIRGIRKPKAKVWLKKKQLSFKESTKHTDTTATRFDWGNKSPEALQLAFELCRHLYGPGYANDLKAAFLDRFLADIAEDSFDLTLDLREFNAYIVQPLIDDEPIVWDSDDDFVILEGPGPTGHGDICWSDADPGL
jgi:hypothetical protein